MARRPRVDEEGCGVVAGWQPATGLEHALLKAIQGEDQGAYLRLLSGVGLLAPVRQDQEGRNVGWVTSHDGGRTFLLCYTSPGSLAAAGGDQARCVTASLEELARRWPDPTWWLAVNSGLPTEALVSPQYLGELLASVDPGVGQDSVGNVASDAAPAAADASLAAGSRSNVSGQGFRPANGVEAAMLAAVREGDTDAYVKALLLAELVVPRVGDEASLAVLPGDDDFPWRTVRLDGERCIPLFTSEQQMAAVLGDTDHVRAEAVAVVRGWPDQALTMALNPGTPLGASLPGPEVAALGLWAAEIGLVEILERAERQKAIRGSTRPRDGSGKPSWKEAPQPEQGPEEVDQPESARRSESAAAELLQKLLPPAHVSFYLERGYHLVSGFVHRLSDVGRQAPLDRLYRALGLGLDSPFGATDLSAHVVRWPAYGGGSYGDSHVTVNDGHVIQTRISGVPLPHGAVLCRIDRTGGETVVARYDADSRQWRGEPGGAQ